MIGRRILHYRILEKIGQGGMGEVFLAQDTSLDRRVAIKFLPPEVRDDSLARARFLREAKSAATLDHPHICVVHEAGEVEGVPFIVMEYIEGESLDERLARGPLPLAEALHLAAEIAEALEEAHSRQIIHRDLKPANVMLARTGHAKVMDFGLAKRLLASDHAGTEADTLTEMTRAGTTVGTLAYMSPEQLQGNPVDQRSDIFSFGTMLYEMIAGVHPFRKEIGLATAAAILNTDPPPLSKHAPAIPERLAELVPRMMAKDPAHRPSSMGWIRGELKRILLEIQAPPEEAGVLNIKTLLRRMRAPRVAIPAVAAMLALALLGTWFFNRQAKVRWAREIALPEIEKIIEANDVWRNLTPAYRLAEEVEKVMPRDPRLAEIFSKCALNVNIRTEPPGARIFMKEYNAPDGDWAYLGTSPLERARLPIGIFRWKVELDGYEPVLAAGSTWDIEIDKHEVVIPYDFLRVLDKRGSVPSGMVRVPGAKTPGGVLPDFYIDRCEVTNRQFKEFMDKGGYRKREYWKNPFVRDGREVSWQDAMREFVDETGQPGPATWRATDYPEGQADFPVSGVSWYEAAAYAEYAGKRLPTGVHWAAASGQSTPILQKPQLGGLGTFAPFSNFNGKGPVPVGSLPGISPFGALDMAGNVREWCWNETPKGRLIRGGAWNDNSYMFTDLSQVPPMDRSPTNGFRCAFHPNPAGVPPSVSEPLRLTEAGDIIKEKPVPDTVFRIYKEQFLYDQKDLNSRVESRQESPKGWILERISFSAAYGQERLTAYLFIPGNAASPFQTVVYFPGSASVFQRSSRNIETYYEFPMFLSFIVKSGRAVLYPVYKGTFERGSPEMAPLHDGANSHAYSEFLVQLVKDFRRCVDYLETRRDIDAGKIAYYGMSWGASLGAIIPAVEERVKVSVLLAGGLRRGARPESSQIHYVTRTKTPTLMLNGKYDSIFVFETDIKPMFDLLGTPAEHKRLVVDETDHLPSANVFIKETLAWLDRYLGSVK